MTNVTEQNQEQKLKVSDLTPEQFKRYKEFISWWYFSSYINEDYQGIISDIIFHFSLGYNGETKDKEFINSIEFLHGLKITLDRVEEQIRQNEEVWETFEKTLPNPLSTEEVAKLSEKVQEIEIENSRKESGYLKDLIKKSKEIGEYQGQLIEVLEDLCHVRKVLEKTEKEHNKLLTKYNKLSKKGGKNA